MRAGRTVGKVVFGATLLTLVAIGVTPVVPEAEAGGGCRCPLIYAPVQCDHDKTYPNQCVADCHHAQNCAPIGPG